MSRREKGKRGLQSAPPQNDRVETGTWSIQLCLDSDWPSRLNPGLASLCLLGVGAEWEMAWD
jgi:hypothetical protein